MKQEVRVVIVGDAQVGKTSLVLAVYSDSFQENKLIPVMPKVTIPPEVSPEKVATHFIDTSSREQDAQDVEAQIQKADVVCVVYDVSRPETFERTETYWLPRIRELATAAEREIAVILVGNKIDLRAEPLSDAELEAAFAPITARYREVECCVECSAKQLRNVTEIFYFAQKAVLYPTAVLIDLGADSRALRPVCVAALHRIFQLCDLDNDGVLNDDELNAFQQRVFDATLRPAEIEGVKREVSKGDAGGVRDGGLTVDGFVFLHQVFIQKGRLETVWAVLRKFGYGDDLKLEPSYLYPEVNADDNECAELSVEGIAFFMDLFDRFARAEPVDLTSGEARLSLRGLQRLFSTTPGVPWGAAFETHVANSGLTADEFEAQWRATTLYNWRTTLFYAAFFGCEGDTTRLVRFGARPPPGAPERIVAPDGSDLPPRRTFLVYVVGAPSSGKTRLLHGIDAPALNTSRSDLLSSDSGVEYLLNDQNAQANPAASSGEPIAPPRAILVEADGVRYTLALHEVSADALPAAESLARADLLCMLYDASDAESFASVAALHGELEKALDKAELDMPPCAVLANKADLELVEQKADSQPDEFCDIHGYPPPVSVSLETQPVELAHALLVRTINSWEPNSSAGIGSLLLKILGVGVVVAAVGGVAAYALKKNKQ